MKGLWHCVFITIIYSHSLADIRASNHQEIHEKAQSAFNEKSSKSEHTLHHIILLLKSSKPKPDKWENMLILRPRNANLAEVLSFPHLT